MKALLGFVFLCVSVCSVKAQSGPLPSALPDTPTPKLSFMHGGESGPPAGKSSSIGDSSGRTHRVTGTTKLWIAFSLAAYTASALDMHATEGPAELGRQRHRQDPGYTPSYSYENNPLARPLLKLPAPAYYACGAAFTTSINWLSFRMSRSQRFRKVWWVPQALSVAGNAWGYSTYQ
jgi:hypothetical protein